MEEIAEHAMTMRKVVRKKDTPVKIMALVILMECWSIFLLLHPSMRNEK